MLTGDAERDRALVRAFIERHVTCSRRIWPGVPASFEVLGQVTRGASAALWCRDAEQARQHILVLGRSQGDVFHALGEQVRPGASACPVPLGDGNGMVDLGAERDSREDAALARLRSRANRLRRDAYLYPFRPWNESGYSGDAAASA